MIPNTLERRLTNVLASTATVFSFERAFLERNSRHYSQDIVEFCERLDRPLHHWVASELSEHSVVQQLVDSDGNEAVNDRPSSYRSICAALSQRETGVFCIYDVEELSRDGVQLLTRLISYVKEHSLRWQFLLIGAIETMPSLTLGMLHIDRRLPDESEATVEDTQLQTRPAEDAGRPPWLFAGLAILAIVVSGYWLLADQQQTGSVETDPEPIIEEVVELPHSDERMPKSKPAPVTEMTGDLEQAMRLANMSQIRRLIDNGASVNSININQESGLIMAAQASDVALVQELLRMGARVDLADRDGHTALFYACLDNKSEIVRDLLSAGADPNHASLLRKTPLIIAARNGNARISSSLLEKGADANWQDKLGWTPLFYAAWSDDEELASLLLKFGAKVDPVDTDGYTAADIARIRKSDRVALLIEKQA